MSKIASLTGNKLLLAIGAGVVATGAVAASAASLGTLDAQTLGTQTTIVESCQAAANPITVEWGAPTYSAAGGEAGAPTYTATTLELQGLDTACQGLPYSVTVAGAGGVAIQTKADTTAAAADTTVTFDAAFDTKLVENVTVTIYNGDAPA